MCCFNSWRFKKSDSKILFFTEPELQTFFTHTFIMDVGLQHSIYNHTNLSHIFTGQQELGAHTNIFEFQSTKVSTFRWMHLGTRLMGVSISKQCSACSCLRTLKSIVSSDNSQVMLKCTICKYMPFLVGGNGPSALWIKMMHKVHG